MVDQCADLRDFHAGLASQRRDARDAARTVSGAVSASDVEQFFRGLELVELRGSGPLAFRQIAGGSADPTEPFRNAMLALWISKGDLLRDLAGNDLILLDALRKLLPPYTGSTIRLFRGDNVFCWRHRRYGLSWTSSEEAALVHAEKNAEVTDGDGIVLSVEASEEAIICAPALIANDYGEDEYIVDRRRIRGVRAIRRVPHAGLGRITKEVEEAAAGIGSTRVEKR